MGSRKVAIAMPVRNCETTVRSAIQSILNQTLPDWTLFVIDDGSDDRTPSLVEEFSEDDRISLVRGDRRCGIAARLNQAIDLSAGHRYFARMDGDDVSYPERLERQVELLDSESGVDLLGSSVVVFDDAGRALGWRVVPTGHAQICGPTGSAFRIAHPSWCGRWEWVARYRYDARANGCEDQDLLRRSWRSSRFMNLAEILLGYREHGIRLAETLRTRVRTVASVARAEGSSINAATLRASVEQLGKATAETVASLTGMDQVILQRRRLPVPQDQRRRWDEVWDSAHA
jgi:glycosyltransferase involved in cell wall biosynthesis